MSGSAWWQGLPSWLKLVHLFVALPAWLFMVFCILTDQNKSTIVLVAFGIFFGAALLHIVFDRRHYGTRNEQGSISIEEGGDGD